MKRWLGMAGLVLVGTAGWRVGDLLSPDALSLAIGVLIGAMAGLPAALLLATNRRRAREETGASFPAGWPPAQPVYPPSRTLPAPVDFAQSARQAYGGEYGFAAPPYAALPSSVAGYTVQAERAQPEAMAPARRFKIVGEREEWLGDWD